MDFLMIEKAFLWLMIYSIGGWIYETILCSIEEKHFVNRGFLNGPYCPIYGCGALLTVFVLGDIDNIFLLFFLGAFLDCTLEYLTSYVMEKLFHARWWDYSNRPFNLNGRICLIAGIIFGAFSAAVIKVLHPLVSSLVDFIPLSVLPYVSAVVFLLFLTDIIITVTGFTGFSERMKEIMELLENKKDDLLQGMNLYKDEAIERITETAFYEAVSSLYNSAITKLSRQQIRMFRAFPHLKTEYYDSALDDLRKLFQKIRTYKIKK